MSTAISRRSRKRLATRQAISDAATRLFVEHGFDAVTIDQIAEAADVGRMTVFNHFPRKEEMFFDRDAECHDLLRAALRQRDRDTPPIEALAARYKPSELILGAGTVLDPETARIAILSGATYVVSPSLNPDTVRLCNRYQVPIMPGAMTIREVIEGMEAGADIIKLFPGEAFGPGIIKAIRGPLPQAPLMPTGGVDVGNVGEWIRAGAVAVGAGSSLTGAAKTGDYAAVTRTAREFIDKIQAARQK